MSEFIFLPDRTRSERTAMGGLAAGGDIGAALTAGAGPGGADRDPGDAIGGDDGLDLAPIAVPTAAAERAAVSASVAEVEILDEVPESGVLRVRVPGGSREPPAEVPGGTLHPVVFYEPAVAVARVGRRKIRVLSGPAGAGFFRLTLVSSATGAPVPDAVVQIRLKNWARDVTAVTDAAGEAVFGFRAPSVQGATLLVEPGFAGHWGHLDSNLSIASGGSIHIDPVTAGYSDALRRLMASGTSEDGNGVTVGIVDSGVGPHADLPNVLGDPDSSIGHGTHVAGIIGSVHAGGLGGIAPGAMLRSYRVFDDAATGLARNFEIHRAIERAVSEGCHLINLSLKAEGIHYEAVVGRAVEDAADAGVLVLAAAGNDFRKRVAFPARHGDAIAVSACGDEQGLPANAYDRWTLSRDRGTQQSTFFATFSNQGIDGTAVGMIAPGAGIVSTVPGDRYAPMSGTSMACPAAVGAVARILSRNPEILGMAPDRARRDAIWEVTRAALASLGFTQMQEGAGMIQ